MSIGWYIAPGDKFVEMETGCVLQFLDVHPLDAQTLIFCHDGYEYCIPWSQLALDYYMGLIREVPGAGNVREVVPEGK